MPRAARAARAAGAGSGWLGRRTARPGEVGLAGGERGAIPFRRRMARGYSRHCV